MDRPSLDLLVELFGADNVVLFDEVHQMNGIVTRLVDTKGFGFITGEDKVDYFFHRTDFSGFYEDLEVDLQKKRVIQVTFEPASTEKGPRARNVNRVDGGV
jgi:cold shock CspA family protein